MDERLKRAIEMAKRTSFRRPGEEEEDPRNSDAPDTEVEDREPPAPREEQRDVPEDAEEVSQDVEEEVSDIEDEMESDVAELNALEALTSAIDQVAAFLEEHEITNIADAKISLVLSTGEEIEFEPKIGEPTVAQEMPY